jgi:hypothetical protein
MSKVCIGCLLIAVAAVAAFGNGTPRDIVIDVQTVPLAWGDSRLADKLVTELSRNPELRLRCPAPGSYDGSSCGPVNRWDLDSLMDWGTEAGGRYLLVVVVDNADLLRRKSFSLPLIFHKWETVAVIQGEYRFLDLQKRRLLAAEPFKEELVGTQQFQGSTDDNRGDPSLHLTALEKSLLFGRLEDKLAAKLTRQVQNLARGR